VPTTPAHPARRPRDPALEDVADGVWLLRGGRRGDGGRPLMNVYFLRDTEAPDGVLMFDAGVRDMTEDVRRAAASLGGLTRIVLGHGHADHRGTAPALGADVFCHAANRADTEGDGGRRYFRTAQLDAFTTRALPRLLDGWDGGPVRVAGTVAEGDELAAGFRVVRLDGHAPGLIGLYRASDGVALTSDCFYAIDPFTGADSAPQVPHAAFNHDEATARASLATLAALAPVAAWPGHSGPLTGDVRGRLEHALAAA
jgi:hydroxyacylglutathione hydrolase